MERMNLNRASQYYQEYDFRILLERVGYHLSSIEMMIDSWKINGQDIGVPTAKVSVQHKDSGKLSYFFILPRYWNKEYDATFLDKCDNLVVRFSVLFSGRGFFTPCWTEVSKGKQSFKYEGVRMDWDRMKNPEPLMTRSEYYSLLESAKNRTDSELDLIINKLLPRWIERYSVEYTNML